MEPAAITAALSLTALSVGHQLESATWRRRVPAAPPSAQPTSTSRMGRPVGVAPGTAMVGHVLQETASARPSMDHVSGEDGMEGGRMWRVEMVKSVKRVGKLKGMRRMGWCEDVRVGGVSGEDRCEVGTTTLACYPLVSF